MKKSVEKFLEGLHELHQEAVDGESKLQAAGFDVLMDEVSAMRGTLLSVRDQIGQKNYKEAVATINEVLSG